MVLRERSLKEKGFSFGLQNGHSNALQWVPTAEDKHALVYVGAAHGLLHGNLRLESNKVE